MYKNIMNYEYKNSCAGMVTVAQSAFSLCMQVQALIMRAVDGALTIFKAQAERAAAKSRVDASCDKSSAIETFCAWRALTGYTKVGST